jgi:tetratricopeptide (TPR) repeat protein
MTQLRRALVLLLVLTPCPGVAAQTTGLGSVSFPTSGSARAQPAFLRGLALLHSFEYDDAADAFREAQRLDPGFAMAYWGEALTYDHPIWGQHDSTAARAALARLGDTPKARIARGKTPRERAYLEAVEALYGEGALQARYRAYEAAMERVQERYPDDLDAAALHALSLLTIRPEGVTDLRTTVRSAAISEAVLRRNPTHPGATHYLIHAYDDPVLAPLGVAVARRYARIAPRAEHALHMPSHIFVQTGSWDEAVASNEAAWTASKAWVKRKKLGNSELDLHAAQWLHYGYLQQGRFTRWWRHSSGIPRRRRHCLSAALPFSARRRARSTGATVRRWTARWPATAVSATVSRPGENRTSRRCTPWSEN